MYNAATPIDHPVIWKHTLFLNASLQQYFAVVIEYTIYYIAENGLFVHLHAAESALNVPIAALPVEVKFLEVYSKHLKKEKQLPDHLITQILNDDISVKNIKTFDFNNATIRRR